MLNDSFWVSKRHECSPFAVLKTLQNGAESDVKVRNELRSEAEVMVYKFTVNPLATDKFLVQRNGNQISASIAFKQTAKGVAVSGDDSLVFLDGILTLDDDAECKIKVGQQEISFWQFRKRALEKLFFEF